LSGASYDNQLDIFKTILKLGAANNNDIINDAIYKILKNRKWNPSKAPQYDEQFRILLQHCKLDYLNTLRTTPRIWEKMVSEEFRGREYEFTGQDKATIQKIYDDRNNATQPKLQDLTFRTRH
jgi:hypothetical protein